jgi:hypothetical protein
MNLIATRSGPVPEWLKRAGHPGRRLGIQRSGLDRGVGWIHDTVPLTPSHLSLAQRNTQSPLRPFVPLRWPPLHLRLTRFVAIPTTSPRTTPTGDGPCLR